MHEHYPRPVTGTPRTTQAAMSEATKSSLDTAAQLWISVILSANVPESRWDDAWVAGIRAFETQARHALDEAIARVKG